MSRITFSDTPITSVADRKTSFIEYGHASIGSSGETLETPREVVLVVPGTAAQPFSVPRWRKAIEEATRANPGVCLQLSRRRGQARWDSTGSPPRLRVVESTNWDGLSPTNGEFLTAEPLDLFGGSPVEIILVGGEQPRVICRALHAVMDGLGTVHFLQDVFRCLRGEVPAGTNTDATDWDMLQAMECNDKSRLKGTPPYATGGPAGDTPLDTWRARRVAGPRSKLLPTVLRAIAETSNKYAEQPARIAMPVSLRRYFPDLRTTMNSTSIVMIDVQPNSSLDEIAASYTQKLDAGAPAALPGFLPVVTRLSMHRLDKLIARTPKNYLKRKLTETAIVSHLGRFESADFSDGGFRASGIYLVPLPSNTYVSISSMDDGIWITAGTEEIYATDGRLDDLLQRICEAVEQD